MSKLRNGLIGAAVLLWLGASFATAQTTVSASVYGTFRSSTEAGVNPTTTTENPSNAAGFLLELRHISNPLMGYEVTYSYHRANEAYTSSAVGRACPGIGPCTPLWTTKMTASVPANAHEVTGDWVFSFKLANLRPFALAGGGLLFDVPAAGNVTATVTECPAAVQPRCSLATITVPTQSQTKGVFVYGAGLDWTVLPHIGLRFQYRGNVYKAADLTNAFTSTNKFTQSAKPMVGVFFRF